MKRPSFINGVIVAFVFALAGAAAFSSLKLLLGSGIVLKLLISGLGGIYVLYLLSRSNEKTGRLTIPVLWLTGAISAWFLLPEITLFAISHIMMMWLIRSLYFHSSVLPALLDFGLCGLSLLAAIATALHSHSMFLTIWSFFLLQALFVAIPSLTNIRQGEPSDQCEQRFKRALHTAEAAVRRIHTAQ